MSSEDEVARPRTRARRSTRPSVFKIMNTACLSEHFGVSLSSSESSDQEFTPLNFDNDSSSDHSSSSAAGEEEEEEEEVEEEEEEVEEEEEEEIKKDQNDEELQMKNTEPSINEEVIAIPSHTNDAICCVCLETSHDHDIVTCDGCGLSVHEGCYGVPENDDVDETRSDISSFSTIPWFCDLCKVDVKNPSCELCPVSGGLFKQSINGSWVHALCGLYCTGVEYIEPRTLSGLTLDEIPPSKWGAKSCQLCEEEWMSQTGICIRCDAGMCKVYFHTTCGQKHGLLCEAEDTSDSSTSGGKGNKMAADPYYAHCPAHCDKKLTKKKKARYVRMIQNLKQFKKQENSRLSKYLSEAKITYMKLYSTMKEWYHPDKVVTKGQRLLHHHPKAFKMLTEKAQLFGHVLPQQQQQSSRGALVSIGLTEEYVKFFNERTSKLANVQTENNRITTTLKALKYRSNKIQESKKQVETELASVKEFCIKLSHDTRHICTLVNKVAGKVILDSSKYIINEESNSNHTSCDDDTHVCCVCQSSNESHLMTKCDSCKKLYHIGCLDPPLTRVPAKSSRVGWECEDCCFDSDDKLKPVVPMEKEPQSRFGRKLNRSNNDNYWLYLPEFSPAKKGKKR